jgi:hypothetical protein
MKLACPSISRASSNARETVFNEGVSVPPKDWAALTAKNPALVSKDKGEQYEATRKAMLHGELAKYRGR